MEKKPLVSVVIPVRNSETEIEPFLRSMEEQTFKDFQLLFSYGTSKDGTLDSLKKGLEAHSNLKADIHDCGLLPLGPSKNYWLDRPEEQSPFFCFIDIDDRPEANFLAKLISFSSKGDLIQCGFTRIDKKTGKEISKDQIHNEPYREDIFNDPSLIYTHTATWNKLFKRSLIGDDVRFPSGKKFEDLVFVMEYLAKSNSIYSINEPLYRYIVSSDTRSSMKDKEQLQQSDRDVQDSLLLLRAFYEKNKPEAITNGFLDALVFLRYGIGFTTRMCLSGQEKQHHIIKSSRSYLDQHFPSWRKTPFLSWRASHRFGKKTWFVRWCRRLYKCHCFGVFVLCYLIFTHLFRKDIKP
jgi:glycosyltransferase involved in cell wall biosynthesis